MINFGERFFEFLKSFYKINVLFLYSFIYGVSFCVDWVKWSYYWNGWKNYEKEIINLNNCKLILLIDRNVYLFFWEFLDF